MATKPRECSESGFYHVFQRGVNQFDIFERNSDRRFFLRRLVRYASEYDVEIHAWCLMSNHTHLLVRAGYNELSALMRKIGSVYARYFNRAHSRSGPLFEGRFGSVCVNTDAQFMGVMRYIHRNPVHHEERTLLGDYPWSSYAEYLSASPGICKLDFAMSLFGGVEEFTRFHEAERDHERYLDIGTTGPMRDAEARWRANRVLEDAGFGVPVSHVGRLPRKRRDMALFRVRRTVGCSLRQLQRLTAVAYSTIRAAVETSCDDVYLAASENSRTMSSQRLSMVAVSDMHADMP